MQPQQPAHGASFVGERVELLVDRQGQLRRTLASHSNCYLGTLRKQVGGLRSLPPHMLATGCPCSEHRASSSCSRCVSGPQIHPICRLSSLSRGSDPP